jgi:predicted TIM-barrel fold metal-dependent hydrolase
MTKTHVSKSAAIRARLNHPIIDSDGHMLEFEPGVLDYLKQIGGSKLVERYISEGIGGRLFSGHSLSAEERRDRRVARSPWWGLQTKNTLDRATATLPKLLYERLDEFGLDFVVLYPSLGLLAVYPDDEEVRRAACRAYNTFHADIYREYADRITPVAVIPMHTPQEAIDELQYAVNGLGMKAIFMPSFVRRPIPATARKYPEAREAFWLDTYGLDSAFDYDPVWAKCVELKVPPGFHSNGMGWGARTSISNYIYNHIGNFAAAGEAVCKSLFMAGVTRRFPSLKFAFLEGGAGWACSLYADLIGHWEKRNIKGLENYDPANLDRELLMDLYTRYGGKMIEGKLDQLGKGPAAIAAGAGVLEAGRDDEGMRDEWAACQIQRAENIRDLFVSNFYFGCEADDPINAWAFNSKVNPFGARLKAIFSSDIGHWDVPDIAEVVEEAYELVEKELITEEDFRDFVFANPVSLYAGMNPDFFKGTVVDQAVNEHLEI